MMQKNRNSLKNGKFALLNKIVKKYNQKQFLYPNYDLKIAKHHSI